MTRTDTRTGTHTGSLLEHRIGAEGLFSLTLRSGEARLRAIDGDQVRIHDRHGRDLADVFAIEPGDGSLSLRGGRGSGGHDGSAEIEVDVPRRATVVVEHASGDLEVEGLAGDQRYRSASGDLRLRSVSGLIAIDSASGDVDVVAVGSADVTLHTVSGDVELRAGTLRSLHATTTSGDLKISGRLDGAGPFSIVTVSGDALLAPAGDVRVEMTTLSGDLNSELGGRVEGGRGRRSVTIGSGRPTVEFRSTSGDMTLVRPKALGSASGLADDPRSATPDDENAIDEPESRISAEPTAAPDAAAHPTANGAIAAAYDEARLRILRSLERGEIDVAEAGRRLETLDEGPDDPSADTETTRFDPSRSASTGSPGA